MKKIALLLSLAICLGFMVPFTATADDILEGKTAWINGNLVTGIYNTNSLNGTGSTVINTREDVSSNGSATNKTTTASYTATSSCICVALCGANSIYGGTPVSSISIDGSGSVIYQGTTENVGNFYDRVAICNLEEGDTITLSVGSNHTNILYAFIIEN